MPTMVRICLALILATCASNSAFAGSWADALFDGLARDYGSVPRGPTLHHSFHLTNQTGHPVHIAGVRVSCGCVTAWALKADLAPGETSAIMTEMDTRRFSGHKTVTVYVNFDRPQWEEVRLMVQANGRDDVAFVPETLAFGRIREGATPAAAVNMAFYGSAEWRIVEAKCDSNYVLTTVQELRRGNAEVLYQLTARMRPDCPVGRWYTDVWVTTNNPSTPRVRVPLTIEIEPPLVVTPALTNLGEVRAGEEIERKVIVRGGKPFRISAIEGQDEQFSVKDMTAESKPVHVLVVKLKARAAGDLQRAFRVVTDRTEHGSADFQVVAQVVP
jgi:hypothetical protein